MSGGVGHGTATPSPSLRILPAHEVPVASCVHPGLDLAWPDPSVGWVALRRDTVVGVLHHERGQPHTGPLQLAVAPDHDPEPVARALLSEARPGQDAEVVAWDHQVRIQGALRSLGLSPGAQDVVYSRELQRYRCPFHDVLTRSRCVALSRAQLLGLLEACLSGGSYVDPRARDPAWMLQHALGLAREREPPAHWEVLSSDGVPCGLSLPCLDPLDPDTGSLLFLGLAPWVRGRGLARIVHAQALEVLRCLGARIYVDETTSDNAAMQRVFERSGCARIGSRSWFRGSCDRSPGGGSLRC